MQSQYLVFRRLAVVLALAIALTALLTTLACGSAVEPDPPTTSAPVAEQAMTEQAMTEQGNDHHAGAAPPGHDTDTGSSTESQAPTDAVVINLPIVNRDTTLTRDDLRVSQGDNVSINFTADEPGEIHLHGYDLTASVSPGSAGELNFVAVTAGAFAINFHVFASDSAENVQVNTDHHHASDAPSEVVSELPVSLTVTAEADADGGIDVRIATEGFRFAPELVDQAHTPGSGHAHVYLDGEKLGRVFEPDYHIAAAPPGEREVRVSLNTNDHSELVYGGKRVEATVLVTVPDVGQGRSEHGHGEHGHGEHDHGARAILDEVHLGNLEVYP